MPPYASIGEITAQHSAARRRDSVVQANDSPLILAATEVHAKLHGKPITNQVLKQAKEFNPPFGPFFIFLVNYFGRIRM